MKKNKHLITCMLFIILIPTMANAEIWLPSFFSDKMVLQQNQKVFIWGTDIPCTTIKISASWGAEASTNAGSDGKWKTSIATPGAGGPYTVHITGSDEIILKDVMTGEVWLCSGQSNMEMPVKGFPNQFVTGSNEAILNSRNNSIRVFQIERQPSTEPVDDVDGRWQVAEIPTTPEFSAAAYFFGQTLQEILDVPVGLIVTSWGGSKAEAWMDKNALSAFEEIPIPDEIPKDKPQKSATLLFNGMLHPFIGYHLRGVIWYQGESNSSKAEQYKMLFPALINSWRTLWGQGEFPFYFVQIAPFGNQEKGSLARAKLREAQLHTMLEVKNTGMVVTADIGDCDCIHPAEKRMVGRRLAYWALAKTYGIEGVAFSGPVYKSMEITDDGKIKIAFDYAENGLSSLQKPLTGFQIAGADSVFVEAEALINRDGTLSVWSENVPEPVAVRYAFGNCIIGSLYNTAGLPASPFRTDNW
jgi:sialate O-acetylesterase